MGQVLDAEFRFVSAETALLVKPGTIMFLPARHTVPKNTYTDPKLHAGAFDHPVTIISCPEPTQMKLQSRVQIAIMTSFNGNMIKNHLANKGIKISKDTVAAQHAEYLRVVTASKPYAKDTLKLRNGKGMKRDCSYICVRGIYTVGLRALAHYGFRDEEVDTYRLTAHATKKLVDAVMKKGRRVGKLERKKLARQRKVNKA